MTGRRVRKAHNPSAAAFWRLAEVTLLVLAASALGSALGIVAADWIRTGHWQVTATSAGVAFLGVPLGVFAAVAHALRVHAIDGPPWTPQAKCSECGAGPGSRCPTYCSQWEPERWDDLDDDDFDDEDDHLPDPWDAGERLPAEETS